MSKLGTTIDPSHSFKRADTYLSIEDDGGLLMDKATLQISPRKMFKVDTSKDKFSNMHKT